MAAAIGRVVETAPVRRAWDMLTAGHRALLLVGPVGIGKSSCLLHLAEHRRRGGAKVAAWPTTTVPANGLLIVDDAHLLGFGDVSALLRSAVASGGEVVFAARQFVSWRDDFVSADLGLQVEVDLLGPWDVGDICAVAAVHLSVAQLALLDAPAIRADTGGLPWLVGAVLRDRARAEPVDDSCVVADVVHAWQQLPETAGELALALACGYELAEAPLAPSLRALSAEEGVAVADQLLGAGMLELSGGLPPLIQRTLLAHAPRHHVAALVVALIDELEALGVGFARVPQEAFLLGLSHPHLAEAALARGHSLSVEDPRSALTWFALASQGVDSERVATARARARGLQGDIGAATAELAALPVALHRETRATASCLATLTGQHDQALALMSGAPEDGTAQDALSLARTRYAAAAVANLDELAAEREAPDEPGSFLPDAFVEMVGVVRAALLTGQDALPALVRLTQAGVSMPAGRLDPDDLTAVAAIVALQSGEAGLADTILSGPRARLQVGVAARQRVSCVRAWVAMTQGRYGEVASLMDTLDPRIGRDRMWLLALGLGLARRQDDLATLVRLWAQARPAVMGVVPGLFDLLPLGEFHVAAARLKEPTATQPAWSTASAMVARLGQPTSFAPLLHWYGIQAAIFGERHADLAPHARVLAELAGRTPFAATLANAGRCWLRVLAGDFEVAEVADAARALGLRGLPWDGARLAAHAAARSREAHTPRLLIEVARELQPRRVTRDPARVAPSSTGPSLGRIELSPREREVAGLVLQGLTYKEIGTRLYLSAKTIEHHMARIRRRSNATSRQELLARLSLTLAPPDDDEPGSSS